MIRDVTPVESFDQEKVQSLWLLDTLLMHAQMGFAFFDRELRFVRINERLAEINGYSVEAHLGRTVEEILPTLAPALHEMAANILATGQPVLDNEFTGETARAPGVICYWNASWYPVRDDRGEIIGFGGVVEEITARKIAEAKRIETERNYGALAKASSEATYRMSADWSSRLAIDGSQLFSSSEVPLDSWDWLVNTIPGDEHARVRQAISDAIAGKNFFELEHRVLRADGSTGWVHSRAMPLLDENEVVSTWFGTASDITERKHAEEARQKSDAHLRYALHAAEAGAWDWIISSGEISWSPENYVLYDMDPGPAPPRFEDWDARLHPDDRDRVNEHVRAVLDGQLAEFRTEFRIVSRQGAVRWLLGLGHVERNPDGQAIRMSGINLDITGRKRAEAAILESEHNYRALVMASSEIAYRMSADWSMMMPLDGREIVGSSDKPLTNWAWLDQNIPRDEHIRIRKAISEAIAQNKPFDMEHRVLRPDGSIGWVHSRAVPVFTENQCLISWFGAASDISERKQIKQNLIEALAAAEKANQAKSEFLSRMSHELRTPLNAILGFAQLLESGAPEPTPAQRRHLEQIIKGGWYLLDLINELLDLAQIESGKLSLTDEQVSLAEVMLECRDMIEPQASKRGIDVTFPSFELLGYVRADRTRVKQVLINLLSNAIKYNKAQGTVTVEYALSPPDAIRVSVRDTGDGLAPDQLAQLFVPFNRLGKETSPEQGTGIGLVMSKCLVEIMGGTIGADSTVGVGSVFWFELKQAPASPAGREQAALG